MQPVASSAGMVVSQEALASGVGAAILRRGGNAIDAAVATAFALGVPLPQAGNLGGGGFLVFWKGPQRRAYALNFRKMAPRRATAQMFLNGAGDVDRVRATRSLLSTAVPGSVAGLLAAQGRFGRLSRQAVLSPRIALAVRAFPVYPPCADFLLASSPPFPAARTRGFTDVRDGSWPVWAAANLQAGALSVCCLAAANTKASTVAAAVAAAADDADDNDYAASHSMNNLSFRACGLYWMRCPTHTHTYIHTYTVYVS